MEVGVGEIKYLKSESRGYFYHGIKEREACDESSLCGIHVTSKSLWKQGEKRERTGRYKTTQDSLLVFLKSFQKKARTWQEPGYDVYASCVIDPFPEDSFPSSLIFPLINLLLPLCAYLSCFSSCCPQVSCPFVLQIVFKT